MKEMAKARIISKRSVDSVLNERIILTELHNPYIINMLYAFQDRENLYLCMDLLEGGDLRFHINKKRKFSEE
jgi:serine/threonine protein kinase